MACLLPIIQAQFGKDAKMGMIVMDKNRFSNHVANYVKLPDGKSYVVDVWRSMVDRKPAIYTEDAWKDVRKKELGGEPQCYIAMDK